MLNPNIERGKNLLAGMARGKCCSAVHLKEDNARFVLLILSLLIYVLVGAQIFSVIESDRETQDRLEFNQTMEAFKAKYNGSLNETEFMEILKVYAEADKKGFLDTKRPRWDFPGAFYFVCTVVSTIGFGMTSPSTVQGRVMLIAYGLPGCAACILFYNLFLERLITFLAFIMKKCHERQIRRQNQNVLPNTGRRPSQQSDDNLESWKPSVYYVLLYLCIASTIIACVASVMYTSVEGWDYAESIYFCFVAFSTIGFGDLVTSQREISYYKQPYLYRFGNFIFLTAGVCCIYSLYNVVSIVIKQLLNWILKKLECNHCHRKKPRPRRNAITPGHLQRQVNSASKQQRNDNQANGVDITDVDSNYDSETDGRRMSGEMISMKDFLAANKVSLAVMQKQLYETSQHRKHHASSNGAFGLGQGVGGLAMLNNKLQETERRD